MGHPLKADGASITRRVTLSVLLLQFVAAAGLLIAVTVHEKDVQYRAFDAGLRAGANALLGAVQEDVNEEVRLDAQSLKLPRESVFRVTEDGGRLVGEQGSLPALALPSGEFQQRTIGTRSYRFYSLRGQRDLDPARNGGVHHQLNVLYGQPDSRVWHEVVEATQFVAGSTVAFVSLTALLLVLLLRRLLLPIRTLAAAAGEITPTRWDFVPPEDARRFIELQPLTSAIEHLLQRLRKAFEQQKRFTSDAAHELKTDLAIVKSSLQLITLRPRTVQEHEHGLAASLTDLTRLERTVQRMLTLARLEQSEETGARACYFRQAFEDAVQQSEPIATLKSVALQVHTEESAWIALNYEDAVLLCSNVIVNAIQHSPEKGVVELSSVLVEGTLHVRVRDHGVGIQGLEAALLFQPFYRSDTSRSRTSGGSGLGLSICKALCERAGGSITIGNHEHGGAVVAIELPLVHTEAQTC